MRPRRNDGALVCVTGASRSGKTVWVAQQCAAAPRLLVWDLVGEWGERYRCKRVTSLRALAKAIAPGAPPGRIAFHCSTGMTALFESFCALAWIWVRVAPGALVIEETASVTSPGKAPARWGDIVRMGLRHGVDLYAITQRPAESDKTAFGNATVIHSHRMAFPRDRACMAEYLSVSVAEVAALRPLEFIEHHADGTHRRGVVTLPKRR